MFAAWLEALDESGRLVMNSPAIARGNIDKSYLRDLEAAGIPIPRTVWLDRPDAVSLERVLREERWDSAVLKPRISATAHGMFRIAPGAELSDADLAPSRLSGALVQEFISEIRTGGEISLVYAGREFSHAVSKHALEDDFRVQKNFGGSVIETTPSAAVLALASRVMSMVPAEAVFARIDVVAAARGPVLMELELIEPELYFSIVPGSAEQMAQVLVDRLSGM